MATREVLSSIRVAQIPPNVWFSSRWVAYVAGHTVVLIGVSYFWRWLDQPLSLKEREKGKSYATTGTLLPQGSRSINVAEPRASQLIDSGFNLQECHTTCFGINVAIIIRDPVQCQDVRITYLSESISFEAGIEDRELEDDQEKLLRQAQHCKLSTPTPTDYTVCSLCLKIPLSSTLIGLKTLYSGNGSSDVDIIAVHGLGANPDKTWTYQHKFDCMPENDQDDSRKDSRETMWLRDLLPNHVPNARIMTFNYASDWLRDAPRESMKPLASKLLASIDDLRQERDEMRYPERPIVFIGHSFGGLLIEQALGIAKHDKCFHHLLNATAGVVFLGTPHRGADIASWGDTLATCAAAFGLGPDTQLLNILRKDSKELREIFNEFAILSNDLSLDLICFFELYKTTIKYRRGVLQYLISSTCLVVDRFSATIDGYTHYGLHSDHCMMNKFKSEDDGNFKLVAYKIKTLVNKAPKAIADRSTVTPEGIVCKLPDHVERNKRWFIVPHARYKSYVPRPSVDREIQEKLEVYPQKDAQVRIALYGLQGSGKTLHALNFAYQQRENKSVFWVNGTTESTFTATYVEIGQTVGLFSDEITGTTKQMCLTTKEWLDSPRSGNWIMIIDGVDDLSDSFLHHCDSVLPDDRGIMIFTSANTRVIGSLVPLGFGMEIGAMSESTAESMIRTIAGQPRISSDELLPLLDLLSRHPLAIAHAAAFIRENHLNLRSYFDAFRGYDDDLKERLLNTPTQSIPQSVLRAWDLNFYCIRNKDQRASKLIKLMCELGEEVPRSLLRSKRLKGFELEDDLAFDKCMGLLISYALVIPRHSKGSYRLHPLVSLRTRQKIKDRLLFRRMAIDIVNDAFPQDRYCPDYIGRCAAILPHAESVLRWSSLEPTLSHDHQILDNKVQAFRHFLNDNLSNRWADWGFVESSYVYAEQHGQRSLNNWI